MPAIGQGHSHRALDNSGYRRMQGRGDKGASLADDLPPLHDLARFDQGFTWTSDVLVQGQHDRDPA